MRLFFGAFICFIVFSSEMIGQDCTSFPNFMFTSVSANAADCGNNGSIDIEVEGGGAQYEYRVESTDCTTTTWANDGMGSSTYSIGSLTAFDPGCDYTVYARIQGTDCIISQNITVPSTYTTMGSVGYTITQPQCTDDPKTGDVQLTMTGGKAPYTFLETGSMTSNTNGTFNGLAEGTYEFTVTDACGDVRTVSGIVISEEDQGNPKILSISASFDNANCEYDVTINPSTSFGVQPFTYQLCDENGMNCGDVSTTPNLTVPVPSESTNYKIKIIDACGKEGFYDANIDLSVYYDIIKVCDADGNPSWQIIAGSSIPSTPIDFTLSGPAAETQLPLTTQVTQQYNNVLATVSTPGAYSITGTTPCGTLATSNFTIEEGTGITAGAAELAPSYCTEGAGSLRLDVDYYLDLGAAAATYEITSSTNTSLTLPYTLTVKTNAGLVYLDPVPEGTHTITVTDPNGCDDQTFDVTISNTLEFDLTITQTPGCSNSVVTASMTSTDDANRSVVYEAMDGSGNVLVTNTTGVFNSVPDGTYTIRATSSRITWPTDNCDKVLTESVTVAANTPPTLTGSRGFVCDSDATYSSALTVTAQNGVPPYEYRYKEEGADESTWSAWTTSNQFTDLPVGTYDVQVKDACGQTGNAKITIEVLGPLQITFSGIVCTGEMATLTVDPLTNGTYSWKLPDGTISPETTNTLTIDNFQVSDKGLYEVTVALDDCITRVVSFNIDDTKVCAALPVTLTRFWGENLGASNRIEWTIKSAKNFERFELESSLDAKNWETANIVLLDDRDSYTVWDKNVNELKFYRLKLIDLDGVYTYSQIISISPNSTVNQIVIFPNPVIDVLTIQSNGSVGRVRILDASGSELEAVYGQRSIDMTRFTAGFYFLEIQSQDKIQTFKFVKK